MSDATTPLDAELAALWAELPLGERSAAAALRTLAESTGIDEAVLERHWREALLTEVAQLAAADTGPSRRFLSVMCGHCGPRRMFIGDRKSFPTEPAGFRTLPICSEFA